MAAPERMPIDKEAVAATGAQASPAGLRNVHLITSGDTFKTLYWDRETAGMRPNLVFVDQTGAVVFESNEVGLKGDPLDPQRKLAIVWGDSVVFSSGRGWPCLLDRFAPGYQFLNGGLDGDLYPNILRRADALNRSHSVALNLLMLGWHPFVLPTKEPPPASRLGLWGNAPRRDGCASQGNRNLRSDLTAFLAGRTNVVVATMPTALNSRIIGRDLSSYIKGEDDETGFRFLGNGQYRLEYARLGYEHIVERNAITREVCAQLGVRLIDLFALFETENLDDFREHFIDVLHLRPRSYPLLVEIVYEHIGELLE